MSERLILELKSKFKNELQLDEENRNYEFHIKDNEINKILNDIQLTLKTLNYTNNEIKNILPIIHKETASLTEEDKITSFEKLLKLAMNYLDDNSSNFVR